MDTFAQTVMPSLHAAGWQRRHLDWEFKLRELDSEPDRTLVDGIINATESFLRSSEVHRLFIQELVQGTFDEASDDHLRAAAVRHLIEAEILTLLQENRTELMERLTSRILEPAGGQIARAEKAAAEGMVEVERLLCNHTESL